MDLNIIKLLKDVKNLDDYIGISQEVANRIKNAKVHINITTVLALKKIRCLEVEFSNKYSENGAACIIFERLLLLPPSKTWGVLGKELVSLLQYWLDAIRKHLMNRKGNWWSFLKIILKFVKEIQLKDTSLPNILVELTAECLLDIATQDSPDDYQRHEILHCLNMYSAECSREIRFAMRNTFGDYFVKLARVMGTSGYLPCQYSALETLVRWMVPRQDPALRAAAAKRWLPEHLCPAKAKDLFLNAGWQNFFLEAREFLNELNAANGLVTSVLCRRLTIGDIVIIAGTEKQQTWLDINSSGKSITVLLDPGMLDGFKVPDHKACETLVVEEANTITVQLHRVSQEITLSVSTQRPPRILPVNSTAGEYSDVTIVVTSRADLRAIDSALTRIFGRKYSLLLDLNEEVLRSPTWSETKKNEIVSDEDTRFSHPVEVKRRKHSGYVVRSKYNIRALSSTSTASTSSLAQLHEKLTALPRLHFDKEPVSVCAQPQLSNVTEISEIDDRSIQSATELKFRPYGVCHKNIKPQQIKKKAESDNETHKLKSSQARRPTSPIVSKDHSTSCLLVATIGSADDSVINDTLERLSKNKDFKGDNVVDLILEEAFRDKFIEKDSNIDNAEKPALDNNEFIEDLEKTPKATISKGTQNQNTRVKKNFTVISKSTTDDDSNTEVISDTQIQVNTKTIKPVSKENQTASINKHIYDVRTVENFFSQHFNETKAGDIVVSPTLARKINESNSESSESVGEQFLLINDNLNIAVEQFDFNDVEIFECLNEMIDKVCSDFDKCTEYLNNNENNMSISENALQDKAGNVKKKDTRSKRNVKSTYISKKEKTVSRRKRKNSNETKIVNKMSTIIEHNDEDNSNLEDNNFEIKNITTHLEIANDLETPILKRKRKLYSPKDYENQKSTNQVENSDIEDNSVLSDLVSDNKLYTPKTSAACYKEIEKERKTHLRCRKSRGKANTKSESNLSPRTIKMDTIFNKLKETVESDEKITFATKNCDVYNFTSDSEDDDFKRTKIETNKRFSNDFASADSAKPKRRVRQKDRRKKLVKSSNGDVNNTMTKQRKPVHRIKKLAANTDIDSERDVVDERMREATSEVLNTSIIAETAQPKESMTIEPILPDPPKMELIDSDIRDTFSKKQVKKPNKKRNNKDLISAKKEKNNEKRHMESLLPELVIEAMPQPQNDHEESVTAILEKCKRFKEGIDESTNTQNMLLSDEENYNMSSPQNAIINVTDEFCFDDYKNKTNKERARKDNTNKKLLKIKRIINKQSQKVVHNASEIELIEVRSVASKKSETSIATDGITAHGDFEEAPPNLQMMKEIMQPREAVDLNESMKDYFGQLTRGMNESSNSSKSPNRATTNNSNLKEIQTLRSPIILVERLSFDDINKWMPSRRTSDTESYTKSSPEVTKINAYLKENEKTVDKTKNVEKFRNVFSNELTPSVTPIAKISLEEFNKWLPMPKLKQSKDNPASLPLKEKSKGSPKRVYHTRSKTHTAADNIDTNDEDVICNKATIQSTRQTSKLKNASRDVKNINNIGRNNDNSSSKENLGIVPERKLRHNKKILNDNVTKTIENESDDESRIARKTPPISKKNSEKKSTVISPIIMLKSFTKRDETDSSEEDECLKKIRSRFTRSRSKTVTDIKKSVKAMESPNLNERSIKDTHVDYEVLKSPLKRNLSPVYSPVKKFRVEDNFGTSIMSGPTVSSVNDWFKKMETTRSRANETSLSMKDVAQNVMEKLDTTLTEINLNTSKQFVNLFMDAHTQLQDQREARRQLYKEIATDILSRMIKLMDEKFADLDQRSQETDNTFMQHLKKQAFELIQEDCKKKRAMVVLLKEDIQAVMDYIDKSRSTGSP